MGLITVPEEGNGGQHAPVIATLHWSLCVECPWCEGFIDLAEVDHEHDNRFARAIFNNDWACINGSDVSCPECDREIIIQKVEY